MKAVVYERLPAGGGIVKVAIDIDDRSSLGRGATATILPVSTDAYQHQVAKIYHQQSSFDQPKIEAMVENPPRRVVYKDGDKIYPYFAWPTHIVADTSDRPIGFLMPRVDENCSWDLGSFLDRLRIDEPKWRDKKSLQNKLWIGRNLALLLYELHAHRHYVIDFKPQNIKVFWETSFVAILDCDSFSIQSLGQQTFPATNYSSEYIAPEALINGLSPKGLYEAQDRFALAVVLFQLLNNAIHPFSGILARDTEASGTDDKVRKKLYGYGLNPHPLIKPRPDSIHHCFDDGTRLLFDRAFVAKPSDRPTAKEWVDHFHALLTGAALQSCSRKPKNPAHDLFVGKPCGACHIEDIISRPPQPPTPPRPRPPSPPIPPVPSHQPSLLSFLEKRSFVGVSLIWAAMLMALVLGPQLKAVGPPGTWSRELPVAGATFAFLFAVAWTVRPPLRFDFWECVRIAASYVGLSELATAFQFISLPTPVGSEVAQYAGLGELRFFFGLIAVLYVLSEKGLLAIGSLARFAAVGLGLIAARYALFVAVAGGSGNPFEVVLLLIYCAPVIYAAILLLTLRESISVGRDVIVIAAGSAFGYGAVISVSAMLNPILENFDRNAGLMLWFWVFPNILLLPALRIARPHWWR